MTGKPARPSTVSVPDQIEIRGLEITCHIGVPDTERAAPQRLLIDLLVDPIRAFDTLPDRIEATVDYHAIARRIQAIAEQRPRHLIETLADEIARTALQEFAIHRARVTVRKFILPGTEFVAVHCTRQRTA